MSQQMPSKDLIVEEYLLLAKVAEALLNKLTLPEDIEAGHNYLGKCAEFALSEDIIVNYEGVKFMRYFLRILKNTADKQPAVAPPQEEVEVWLEPNRTYMATKQLDDGSTIIYFANSNDPANQWTKNGFDKMLK